MKYPFKCKGCGKTHYLICSMNDYDVLKDRENCPYCGTLTERVFESFDGNIKLSNGMYGTGNGGWNN